MKLALVAAGFLALGAALGAFAARLEFAGDILPTAATRVTAAQAAAPGAAQSAAASPAGENQPSLLVVVGGAEHDFGEMDRNAKGKHEFVLRNAGSRPVTLTKGSTTCKCTGFHFEGSELPPGKETTVTLEWEVKTLDPEFSQSAEVIVTSAAGQQSVRLQIHGHVVDAIRPERPSLVLGSISANEQTTARIKVFTYKGAGLEILQHELTDADKAPFFTLQPRPLTADELAAERGAKGGVEVEVTVAPGLPLGAIGQTMKLTTNFPGLAPLEIPIDGRVVGDITALGAGVNSERQLLDLGVIQRGQSVRRTVQLLVKGPHRESVALKLAKVDPAGSLRAELGPRAGDQQVVRYPLQVTIPADAALVSRLGGPGAGAGEIVLSTTHPNVKQYTLYVRFAVRD